MQYNTTKTSELQQISRDLVQAAEMLDAIAYRCGWMDARTEVSRLEADLAPGWGPGRLCVSCDREWPSAALDNRHECPECEKDRQRLTRGS